MSEVNVALVGVGRWGRNILRVLKELENEGLIKIAALVDVDLKNVRELAKKYNIGLYFTDYLKLSSIDVDAAIIAVPIHELINVAKSLASLGLHIFVEKPVALNSNNIAELEAIAKSSNVIVQPGFIVRFDPVTYEIKKLMRRYGSPKYMIFKRLSKRPERLRKYSIIYDLTIHDIDLTHYFLGNRRWSVKFVDILESEDSVIQTVNAVLNYGDVLISYITDGNLPIKIREVDIAFNEAYVVADYVKSRIYIREPNSEKRYEVSGEEPLRRELYSFIMRIKGENLSEVPTLEDAYIALKIAEEISMTANSKACSR
ncbi:MAG: hypothetical protein B6U85_02145 [Desulfurococcales archaeon ex4484_42]|nr:MAG: hypothetical protein B6U85_02145 [Desulfurococcales archaeon ex4484_42]